MKITLIISAFLSTLISIKGCGDKISLKPVDYVGWIEETENGLKVEKCIGEYIFTAQYKPLDYTVLKAEKKTDITRPQLDSMKKSIEELQYFTLKIATKENNGELLKSGLTQESEYYERVQYFASQMQNDIKLIDGQDTLSCVLYHFERTYGLTPYANFNLGFAYPDKEKRSTTAYTRLTDKILSYNDHIFNLGTVNLAISANDLNNIPNLIIQ